MRTPLECLPSNLPKKENFIKSGERKFQDVEISAPRSHYPK